MLLGPLLRLGGEDCDETDSLCVTALGLRRFVLVSERLASIMGSPLESALVSRPKGEREGSVLVLSVVENLEEAGLVGVTDFRVSALAVKGAVAGVRGLVDGLTIAGVDGLLGR